MGIAGRALSATKQPDFSRVNKAAGGRRQIGFPGIDPAAGISSDLPALPDRIIAMTINLTIVVTISLSVSVAVGAIVWICLAWRRRHMPKRDIDYSNAGDALRIDGGILSLGH